MKKIILFDLDGTINDSKQGIFNSIRYAMKHFGVKSICDDMLYPFLGPPLFDMFQEIFYLSKEDAEKAVNIYREYYKPKGMYEFSLYEGIKETIINLKEEGYTLCLATAKPLIFAEQILKKSHLYQYFDFVGGASLDESCNKKNQVIASVILKNHYKKEDVLMIGDRKDDVYGAIKNKIDILGVLYGYGSKEELEKAGCSIFAESPLDIINQIKQFKK